MQPFRRSSCSESKGSSKVDIACAPLSHLHSGSPSPCTEKLLLPGFLAPGSNKTCRFYAALPVTMAAVGRPSSIGSDGSRDHSFQEPKYIRTSFTPAFFSARKVFDARAPLKQ